MRLLAGFCLAASLSFAQVANGITVTASRTVNIPVSRARFEISAFARQASMPFADLLKLLQPLDVRGENLTSLSYQGYFLLPGQSEPISGLQFRFIVERPTASLEAAFTELNKAQDQLRTASRGEVTMTWNLLEQLPADAEIEAARRGILRELWQDAKTEGEAIAAATGKPLEALSSVSLDEQRVSSLFRDVSTTFQQTFRLNVQFSNNPSPGTEGVYVTSDSAPATSPAALGIDLGVEAPLASTAEQVARRFSSLGIGMANLTSSSLRSNRYDDPLSKAIFTFSASHPFTSLNEILARAEEARRQAAADGLVLTYSIRAINGALSDSSPAARRSALPGMIANARTKADQLARLAGSTTGDVLGVDDSLWQPSVFISGYSGVLLGQPGQSTTISLRFALVRRP